MQTNIHLNPSYSLSASSKFKRNSLQIEKNQFKVLLHDFKIVKNKCQTLSSNLGERFIKEDFFQQIQSKANLQSNSLDFQEIVELKNQLIKALTELYDIERELIYKKERKQVCQNTLNASKFQFPPQIQKFTLQVPVYNSRDEQILTKIDRISSYLYDLRKNMHRLSTAVFKNYETTDFLANQPQFRQLKEKVQRYRMRNQQLTYLLNNTISEEVQKFLTLCDCVEETNQYKIIKIYNNDFKDFSRWYDLKQVRQLDDEQIQEYFQKIKNKKPVKPKLTQVKSEQNLGFIRSIKNFREQSQNIKNPCSKNHLDFTQKISAGNVMDESFSQLGGLNDKSNQESMQSGRRSADKINKFEFEKERIGTTLLSLRQKRKKVFNDKIWEQFDKI